jgi:hypothetical protein
MFKEEEFMILLILWKVLVLFKKLKKIFINGKVLNKHLKLLIFIVKVNNIYLLKMENKNQKNKNLYNHFLHNF